ncbi:MAG: hypothetical protein AB8G26_14355 [Ilumatobacter sp.]
MFTTGSKLLIGASVVSLVATIVYGVGQGGVMGTVGLTSATVAIMGLTGLNLFLRDSNVFADDSRSMETISAAQYAPGSSVWPLGFAFGAVVVAVGLISYQPIAVIGLVALLATGAEWAIQAWSERASGNVEHNREIRSRLSNPLEFPIGAAVAIGVVIYAFSRVMLWLSKTSTTITFSVLATVVLLVAFGIANQRKFGPMAIGSVMAVGIVAIVGAGALAGLDGERDIHEFETTSIWQEEAILHPTEYAEGAEEGKHPAERICESPEAFPEADKKASQTVASKSGTFAVILQADGTLDVDVPGPLGDNVDGLTIPRSNPTNVIFRNESDEDRRLSLDLGTDTFEVDGEDVEDRHQICTTLIEPGAAQLLTVLAGQPSFAFDGQINPNGPGGPEDDGTWFFVPGVDTAHVRVIVP